MDRDTYFMKKALVQAKHAIKLGEVPIGCVIVCGDKVVGRGYNKRNTLKTTLAHAEITAIDKASRKLGDWRLEGCTMYVTLEPCQMCAGALVQSRIDRVVIGAMNPKAGCVGSILNLLNRSEFNHQVETTIGVCKEECTDLLQTFFKDLRIRNKAEKEAKRAAQAAGSAETDNPITAAGPAKTNNPIEAARPAKTNNPIAAAGTDETTM